MVYVSTKTKVQPKPNQQQMQVLYQNHRPGSGSVSGFGLNRLSASKQAPHTKPASCD